MSTDKAIKLSTQTARTLPVGEYPDSGLPGLRLNVTAKARSWSVFKWSRALGKPVRKRIGDAMTMTHDEAKRAAKAVMVEIEDGSVVTRTQRHAEDAGKPTLRKLAEAYTTQRRQKGFKTASWAEDVLERAYGEFMDKPAEALTREDVIARQDKLLTLKKGKATESKGQAASRAAKALSAVFTLAAKQGTYEGKNMGEYAEAPPPNARTRYLNGNEEAKVLEVLAAWEAHELQPWAAPYFKLALATGQRRSNLCAARFDEMHDLEGSAPVWVIPKGKFKSKRDHRVPLLPEAVAIIKAQREAHSDKPWVFPSPQSNSEGHLTDPSYAWEKVRKLAGVGDVTIHDLRRTTTSKLANLGLPAGMTAKLLGHADDRITQKHYHHLETEALRAAMLKVA